MWPILIPNSVFFKLSITSFFSSCLSLLIPFSKIPFLNSKGLSILIYSIDENSGIGKPSTTIDSLNW